MVFINFNGNMATAGNISIFVLFGDIWPQYCKDFLKVFGRHSCKSFKCLGVLLFNLAYKRRRKIPNSRLRCIHDLVQSSRLFAALRLRLLRKTRRMTSNTCLLLMTAAILKLPLRSIHNRASDVRVRRMPICVPGKPTKIGRLKSHRVRQALTSADHTQLGLIQKLLISRHVMVLVCNTMIDVEHCFEFFWEIDVCSRMLMRGKLRNFPCLGGNYRF